MMIHDVLGQWSRYAAKGSLLARGFEYLAGLGPDAILDGRVEIDGDRVFALHSTYETRPVELAKFEAHRRYLDIQYLAAGEEVVGWAPLAVLSVGEPHDDARDVAFFHTPARFSHCRIAMGHFLIFWPSDGHAPGLASSGPSPVRKIVIKVQVD